MRKLLLAIGLLVISSVSAMASTIELTPAQLASFVLKSTTNTFSNFSNNDGGSYSAQWKSSANGAAQAISEVTGLGGIGAGDTFRIDISNDNGSVWNFSVAINGGSFTPIQSIAPHGGVGIFTLAIPGGGLNSVQVKVSAVLPIGGTDRGAEYTLQAPEPSSLLLVGLGLLVMTGAMRRFQQS